MLPRGNFDKRMVFDGAHGRYISTAIRVDGPAPGTGHGEMVITSSDNKTTTTLYQFQIDASSGNISDCKHQTTQPFRPYALGPGVQTASKVSCAGSHSGLCDVYEFTAHFPGGGDEPCSRLIDSKDKSDVQELCKYQTSPSAPLNLLTNWTTSSFIIGPPSDTEFKDILAKCKYL